MSYAPSEPRPSLGSGGSSGSASRKAPHWLAPSAPNHKGSNRSSSSASSSRAAAGAAAFVPSSASAAVVALPPVIARQAVHCAASPSHTRGGTGGDASLGGAAAPVNFFHTTSAVSYSTRGAAPAASSARPVAAATAPRAKRADGASWMRSCHRLQQPDDAFLLGGVVQESAKRRPATMPAPGDASRPAAAAGTQRRPPTLTQRTRLLRSIVPPSTAASVLSAASNGGSPPGDDGAAQAKVARQQRREAHARKKEAREARQQSHARTPSSSVAARENSFDAAGSEELPPVSGAHDGSARSHRSDSACVHSASANSLSALSDTLPASEESPHSATSSRLLNGGGMREDETVAEKKERVERGLVLYFAAMYARRSDAAEVIERAWRCSRARLALYNRRQLLYGCIYVQQKAAALCVAGFLRSRVLAQRRAEVVAVARAAAVVRHTHDRRIVASVRVIERAVAGWIASRHARELRKNLLGIASDERLRQYGAAAVLVQRWWRAVPARRAYWKQRTIEVAAVQAAEMEANRQDRAATVIQRHVRGRQGRHAAAAYKQKRLAETAERRRRLVTSTDVVRVALSTWAAQQRRREEAGALDEQRTHSAASTIQRQWRDALSRRQRADVAREARRVCHSALRIQRMWRAYCASRTLRYLRQLRDTVQLDRQQRERDAYAAARRLQRFVRGTVLPQAHARRDRAQLGRQTIAVFTRSQPMGRGYLARRALGEQYNALRREREQHAAWEAGQLAHASKLARCILDAHRSLFLAASAAVAHAAEVASLRVAARAEVRRDAAAAVVQGAVRAWLSHRADTRAAAAQTYVVQHVIVRLQCWWRQLRARAAVRQRQLQLAQQQRKRMERDDAIVAIWDDAEAAAAAARTPDEAAGSEQGDSWARLYDEE